MDYRKKDGTVVSEDWMDAVSEQAENGDLPGVVVATQTHVGRPRLYGDDELVSLSLRIPKSRMAAIERAARSSGESRSEFIRNAIDRALISA